MIGQEPGSEVEFRRAAREEIQRCARGILAVEDLEERIRQEWKQIQQEDDVQLTLALLKRIAQRFCSQALCEAWQSSDSELHDCACDNLREYLKWFLKKTSYAEDLHYCAYSLDDILHETLVVLQRAYVKGTTVAPDDPAAFLKWSQTILVRQAGMFVEKMKRDSFVSLDDEKEVFREDEQFIDRCNHDPQEYALSGELQQTLEDAILSLRNPQYRDVLWYSLLVGLDEKEISLRLRVPTQKIYMWRFRALKTLRENPELILLLRAWRE